MSWNDGYVSELEYIRGYTRELNPLMLKLALLANGYRPPQKDRLHYLELGFGQGLSLNIHAAANNSQFWGNDFNPSHTINATIMAQASGTAVTIMDDSFEQLAARQDLPEFDVIVLHGVWSWISPENRRFILDIIHSKLALGGILYVSYNTTPGWSMVSPIQHLMMLHAEYVSRVGDDALLKTERALQFTQRLIDVNAAFFSSTPNTINHVNYMKQDNRFYLTHEYYNTNWHPLSFGEVSKQLVDIKLTFAGDASISNICSEQILPAKIKNLLATIKNPLFYQSVRDFCVSQMFRRDIWIKGGARLTRLQQLQLLSEMRFVLLSTIADAPLSITSNIGSIPIDEKIARPIINALAQHGFSPKTINELLTFPELQHVNLAELCDAMVLLCGKYVSPAHDKKTVEQLKPQTDKLNVYLINAAQHSEFGSFLASPVTGGGIKVPPTHQLFLLAIKSGFTSPDTAVTFVWKTLSSQGHCMSRSDGRLCNGDRENLEELSSLAAPFFERQLPILKALEMA